MTANTNAERIVEFTYGGLFKRKGLDERTRLLVSAARFVAMGELNAPG